MIKLNQSALRRLPGEAQMEIIPGYSFCFRVRGPWNRLQSSRVSGFKTICESTTGELAMFRDRQDAGKQLANADSSRRDFA